MHYKYLTKILYNNNKITQNINMTKIILKNCIISKVKNTVL